MRSRVLGFLLLVACGDTTAPDPALLPLLDDGRNRLSVGVESTCALMLDGVTYCWGSNHYLGFAASHPSSGFLPVQSGAPPLVALSGGNGSHRCGVRGDGTAVCWGRGSYGQLGHGVAGNAADLPADVIGDFAWSEIRTGRISTCGVTTDGTSYCWGHNARGEIGNGAIDLEGRVGSPTAVSGGPRLVSIAPGWQHACGLTGNGTAYCWGDNQFGQLGIGTTDPLVHRAPERVAGEHRFVSLSSGWRYTCGITTQKRAVCWGLNTVGQLGDGTTATRSVPTPVAGGHAFVRIATSFADPEDLVSVSQLPQGSLSHTCALTDGGKAYCWGWNAAGQLGDGSRSDRHSPVAVLGDLVLHSIGVGGHFSCAMRHDSVWCWGSHASGQLGIGFASAEQYFVQPMLAVFPITAIR